MMPQHPPHYPSAAPAYGQPAYPPSNFPNQLHPMPVGIPSGPSVFGSVTQQVVAEVGHVVNGAMGGGNAGNAVMGGSPLTLCGMNGQPNFVQGNLVQDNAISNNGTSSKSPPQPMSFPPGFEPGYNKAAGIRAPQPSQQQHQYHHQHRPQHQQQHRPQHQSQQQHFSQPQHQRQFQHQPQPQPQPQHHHQQPHHQHQQHEHCQNQHPDHSQQQYTLQQPFSHPQYSFHPHDQVQPQGPRFQPQHQHQMQQPQPPLQPQHQMQPLQPPLQLQPQHQHQMQPLQPPVQPQHQMQPLQPPVQPKHQMQPLQPPLQLQPQHQHQMQQTQPPLQPQPQHHHQMQQPQPLLQPHQLQQPQPLLQPEPEPQPQHHHQMQQGPQPQHQMQPQSQPQHQMQPPQPPLQPQHQHQMQPPQPPLQTQPQPQPQHQMQPPQPPSQPQPPFQSQFQLQPQIACQQAQTAQFIPFVRPQSQVYPSNIETCPVNGIAIGVPVMGTHHADAACAMQLPKMGLTQEHPCTWQTSHPENHPTSESSQSSRSNITSANHLKGGYPLLTASPMPDTDLCSNGWRPPPMNKKFIPSQSGLSSYPTRPNTVKPHIFKEEHTSSPKPEMKLCPENRKLPINQADSMGTPTSTFGPSTLARSDHCNRETHKGPMRSCETGQRWSSTTKDNQSPFKAHTRDSPSKIRSGFGKVQRNNEEALQWQRPREFRGKFLGRGTGGWSNKQPLRCEPCDRTFTGYEDLNAHLTSHVKCDEEGCTFEAAGKLVKEHKVVKHGKISVQATPRGRRALALRSAEDEEDIKRWREERKNSYPTASNILRKEEERKKMEGEEGSFDEEALKRRERMREVIAKQRKLGFQAPEIPSNYFRVLYNNRRPRNGRVDKSMGQDMVKDQTNGKDRKGVKESLVGQKRACPTEDGSVPMEGVAPLVERAKKKTMEETPSKGEDKEPLHSSACDNTVYDANRKGDGVSKGARKKLLPWQKRNKYDATDKQQQQRPPTLLSLLLQNDVQREKSHLLQCCRFIVNNTFLQEDCSPASLKHFKWIQ